MIYLNTHWQLYLGSAAVRETLTLAEPPVKDFTDAKINYSRNKNKIQHFFINLIFVIEFTFNMSKIHAKQIYQVLGKKMAIPAQTM